jgi:hypothetical protein
MSKNIINVAIRIVLILYIFNSFSNVKIEMQILWQEISFLKEL